MESNIFDKQLWARTPAGKVILRLVEGWEAGITEHGDIAICLTSTVGNDPDIPSEEIHRSQFICTEEDARQIAHMILRTVAYSETDRIPGFDAFLGRLRSPALRAVADRWNQARANRPMPSWDTIRLDDLGPHLGRVWGFNYDRLGGEFIGRVAGSNVMLGFGKSFLGTPLRDLHPPHVFEESQAIFLRAISDPACVHFSGKLFRIGGHIVEGERLILPMGADPDRPDGVLGVSWSEYPAPDAPVKIEMLYDIADWCRL